MIEQGFVSASGAAVVGGALLLLLGIVVWLIKVAVTHVVVSYLGRRAAQRWGRPRKREWREEDEL